ncbi:hypothetical protein DFJ73DRAFT_859252 [Zopfochytrium polystomum]|nr:hypothetical protein DFJ73DRAFT_859252 [Zopfochytrium polystomum]
MKTILTVCWTAQLVNTANTPILMFGARRSSLPLIKPPPMRCASSNAMIGSPTLDRLHPTPSCSHRSTEREIRAECRRSQHVRLSSLPSLSFVDD